MIKSILKAEGIFMAVVFMAGLAMAAQKTEALKLGEKAPAGNVKMLATDGQEYSIQDRAGKNGTLVVFTCNTCPFVKAWDKRITELCKGAEKRKIGVILINPNEAERFRSRGDSLESMRAKAQKQNYDFPYVIDKGDTVATAFGATKTPEIFLFDGDQKLVYHGAVDDNSFMPLMVDEYYLRDALDALAQGKLIKVAKTKSMGCSIKFGKPSKI